ncbi:hypothetical protein J1N35_041809 [Gossypium stocksii]|uniref:RNase H type-1 domain-containing protein n=1 Tax=Gossypium stocksii TaxID=47602 RepID=A0A9D3UGG2_9ROSI|nr:hypothetical protein J1N35_041809 [Gossypium stocksii]
MHAFRDCPAASEIWANLQKLPVQRIETERWRPPETSHVKVNFDAAFSQQHKELCSGIVTRNEEGRILKAKVCKCLCSRSRYLCSGNPVWG